MMAGGLVLPLADDVPSKLTVIGCTVFATCLGSAVGLAWQARRERSEHVSH